MTKRRKDATKDVEGELSVFQQRLIHIFFYIGGFFLVITIIVNFSAPVWHWDLKGKENPYVIIPLISGMGSIQMGILVIVHATIFGTAAERRKRYRDRLSANMKALIEISSEVDNTLKELSAEAKEREAAIHQLEIELSQLEEREGHLQERIENLKDVPIPVAQAFAEIMAPGEQRSARRDYLLFGLGIAVSALVSVVFRLLGWG